MKKPLWKVKMFFLTVRYLANSCLLLFNPRRIKLERLGTRTLPVPHWVAARKICKFIRFFIGKRRKNYCVLQALTLCQLLRRYGVDLQLNLTVSPQTYAASGRRVRGHSWLTLTGERYFDTATGTAAKHLVLLAATQKNINYWIERPEK